MLASARRILFTDIRCLFGRHAWRTWGTHTRYCPRCKAEQWKPRDTSVWADTR